MSASQLPMLRLTTSHSTPTAVIPAKAGIHLTTLAGREMDPRFRGDDVVGVGCVVVAQANEGCGGKELKEGTP